MAEYGDGDAISNSERAADLHARADVIRRDMGDASTVPRAEPCGDDGPDPELGKMAPARRTRGYDMRRVVARICDPGSVFDGSDR